MTASGSITALMTDTATTLALYNSGYTNRGSGTGFSSGAVVGMAIDRDAGLAWFAVNGTWQFGDPAAGTGGKALPTGALFLATGGPGDVMTLRTSAATQTYAPPTGFLVWDAATTQVTASISNQPGTTPGNKQVDVVFNIDIVGTTGAQYKVETEAGQFVQGWTSLTYDSVAKKATGSYLIPSFGFEGQKLKAICQNIGGTVQTIFALTGTNGYVMSTPMRVGMNDAGWAYWSGQNPGRDWFEQAEMGVMDASLATSSRSPFNFAGHTVDNYNHWAEAYSATQNYPDASGHEVCRYQGLSWRTTDSTSKLRAAPSTATISGVGADWKLTAEAPADASLCNVTADGLPTKLPDDPNLTIYIQGTWYPPKSRSDAGFTVAGKTQPGIWIELAQSAGTSRISARDLTTGTFTVQYDGPTTWGNYNGLFYVDRSKCTATLDSTFFISGIPSYETGTPAKDIGSPYAATDKLSDMAPFAGMRFMGPMPVQRFAGNWNGTFTAANNTISGVARQWKVLADIANVLGWKYVWINEPDDVDTSYRTAMATFFRDNLNPGIIIKVERSNEQGNDNYQNALDLMARANALAVGDPAKGNRFLLHCREHNAMVAVWKSVFGAAYASRVKPVLAWMASQTTTTLLQAGLDFENTWQNVGSVATANYFEGGIGNYSIGTWTAMPDTASAQDLVQNAVATSNQTAFNSALDTRLTVSIDYSANLAATLFNWLPSYSMSKGLDKNAIGLDQYEFGQHIIVNQASWDSGIGAGAGARADSYFAAYKRSANMGAKRAYALDQFAKKAPGVVCDFNYVGGLKQQTNSNFWGVMDGMGQTTQEPYASIKTKALALNV
jgi:hypothetical protein